MRLATSLRRTRELLLASLLLSVIAFDGRIVSAQGCVPSRFTSPALGALGGTGGDIYLSARTWQLGFAYRDFHSNQLIVGRQARNDLAPGGVPSFVRVQSLSVSLVYGVTDRLSVTLNAPVSRGSLELTYPDGQRHENTSSGLGEMSVSMSYWLRNAQPLQPGGNVAIGFGVKAPTGRNDVGGSFWRADGTSVPFPVAPAIELGDGGWGFAVSTKGFRPVMERSYVYAGGSYVFNPRKTTDVVRSPGSTVHWAAPDTWDANAGVSTLISSALGLSANLGDRKSTRLTPVTVSHLVCRLLLDLALQSKDVIRMEVRDQDRLDLLGINTGCLHVGHQLAGDEDGMWIVCLYLVAASSVTHNKLVIQLDDKHGDRNRDECSGEPGGGQGFLGLSYGRVAEERWIVGLFPNAII